MIEERIDLPEEFKKEIGSKKMVFGIKQISDALKTGNAEKVLFASNTPKAMLEDLEHFAKLSNIKL
jgi:ribosomal protein L30E